MDRIINFLLENKINQLFVIGGTECMYVSALSLLLRRVCIYCGMYVCMYVRIGVVIDIEESVYV